MENFSEDNIEKMAKNMASSIFTPEKMKDLDFGDTADLITHDDLFSIFEMYKKDNEEREAKREDAVRRMREYSNKVKAYNQRMADKQKNKAEEKKLKELEKMVGLKDGGRRKKAEGGSRRRPSDEL